MIMYNFEELCEKVNRLFKKHNSPGIEAIGENADYFVFDQAPEERGEIEYGPTPLLYNKDTGEFRYIDFADDRDEALLHTFESVTVPPKYRPVYS